MLAKSYQGVGHPDRSIELYESYCTFIITEILAEMGEWESSLKSCQGELVVPSIFPEALFYTGRVSLSSRQQPETAIPYLELAISLKPQDIWYYIGLCDAKLQPR